MRKASLVFKPATHQKSSVPGNKTLVPQPSKPPFRDLSMSHFVTPPQGLFSPAKPPKHSSSPSCSAVERPVNTSLGFELPEFLGFCLAVNVLRREEEIFILTDFQGNNVRLMLPESGCFYDPFRHQVARVVLRGSACSQERVQLGDLILIPRYEGLSLIWKDRLIKIVPLSSVEGVIKNPILLKP